MEITTVACDCGEKIVVINGLSIRCHNCNTEAPSKNAEKSNNLWNCPCCEHKGFASMFGPICTDCANELRNPNNIKKAIEDGQLYEGAIPISC